MKVGHRLSRVTPLIFDSADLQYLEALMILADSLTLGWEEVGRDQAQVSAQTRAASRRSSY